MSHILGSADLAKFIDYQFMRAELTRSELERLVEEAARTGVYGVIVPPNMLPITAPEGIVVASAVGFPSGNHRTEIKVAEARQAVADGAREIDLVIDVGLAKERRFDEVREEVEAVRAAVPRPVVLKVVVESAALSDHELVESCRTIADAGADFITTSTGMHPAGGATVYAVRAIADTVGGRVGVKASGGIRSVAQALELIEAGATRIGVSSVEAVLDGFGPEGVATEAEPLTVG